MPLPPPPAPEPDDDAEINPDWVRHQLCLETLNELQEVEDPEEKINGTLCALAAYYDGVSEVILNMYFDHVGLAHHDPVVEHLARGQINMFHNADLLRIMEPYDEDTNWLDPENPRGFDVLVDEELSIFVQSVREQSRKFRPSIEVAINKYISSHD